jgi:hypothetical protein
VHILEELLAAVGECAVVGARSSDGAGVRTLMRRQVVEVRWLCGLLRLFVVRIEVALVGA